MARIIKFEKNGCMPCKKLDAILDKLGVEVEHKNIDEEDCSALIEEYGIVSTPVLLKIIDENKFSALHGINHTMSEFKEFLEVEDAEAKTPVNPIYANCSNGMCSL